MKITKNQLRQIIKEEAIKLQRKTILENRKKEIRRELRMLNENYELNHMGASGTQFITIPSIKELKDKNIQDDFEEAVVMWMEGSVQGQDLKEGEEYEVYFGDYEVAFTLAKNGDKFVVNGVKVEQDLDENETKKNEDNLKTFGDFEREAEEEMGLAPFANNQGAQGLAYMRWQQYKEDNNIQESVRKVVREGFLNLLKESAENEELRVQQIFEDWLKNQEWFDFLDKKWKDGYGNRIYGELNDEKPPIKDFLKKGDADEIDKAIKNFVKEQFSQLKKIFEEKGYDFHMDDENLYFMDSRDGLNFEFTIRRENEDDYFFYDLKGSFNKQIY